MVRESRRADIAILGDRSPLRAASTVMTDARDDRDGADAVPALAVEAGVAVWASAAWRARAVAWLDTQLAAAGIERIGDVQQPHLRPWSTALSAPTTRGVFWLKAAAPGNAVEIGLYRYLTRLVPESVLTPLAIDEARAWIVLPDGGATLAASAGDDRIEALANALADYARLQRTLAPHAADLLRLGLADMRPAVMPQRFEEALAVVEASLEHDASAEDRAAFPYLVRARPQFAAWCAELARSPVPSSLDHNDLHVGNIFAPHRGEPARFYDFGDSVIAHPFASLLVALGTLRQELGAPLQDPRLQRIQNAYLAEYDDLAPRAELVHTLELACHVGKIARALTWNRALQTLGPSPQGPLSRAPFRWLSAVLDPEPIIMGG
jgi:hypothetical protein